MYGKLPNNRLPFDRARFDDDPQSSSSSQPSEFRLPLDLDVVGGSSSQPSSSFFLFWKPVQQLRKISSNENEIKQTIRLCPQRKNVLKS